MAARDRRGPHRQGLGAQARSEPQPPPQTPRSPPTAFPQLDSPLRLSLPHPGTRGRGGKKIAHTRPRCEERRLPLSSAPDQASPTPHLPFSSLPLPTPLLRPPARIGSTRPPLPPRPSSPSLAANGHFYCVSAAAVPSRAGIAPAPATASHTVRQKMAGGGRETHPTLLSSSSSLPPRPPWRPPALRTRRPLPAEVPSPPPHTRYPQLSGRRRPGVGTGHGGAASLTCGEPGRHLSEG